MKRYLFFSLLFVFSISLSGQKVAIEVIQSKNQGLKGWQVLDNQNQVIFSGTQFLMSDSVNFSLSANTYYYLKVSASDTINPETNFLSLILNGEPILYIKSDIGSGDHLFPFFTGTRSLNAKITGGSSTVISDFPWQVYFISGNFRCGGSIIGNRWIVTAAHCTKDNTGAEIPASEMSVVVGVNNPSNPLDGKLYQVSQAIVNSGFNDQTLLDDIALLELVDTINFANAKPIKLVTSTDVAEGAIDPGVMSWVTGWGYIQVNPNVLPTSLQKVQLPIVSLAQAETVWGTTIPATDLMAGFLNGNKDACNGDSGGPLVVPVLGEYKLAGIVSWGSQNCNTYGAYTRVSDFIDWIKTNTGLPIDFRAPKPAGDTIICPGTESSQYSVQPVAGASAYEWRLLPAAAGSITGNILNSSVIWNPAYNGSANIILRVTVNNIVSDWSRLDITLARTTKLLTQTVDTALCTGLKATLFVNSQGHDLIYTWLKGTQVIQSGTSNKLVFQPAAVSESGIYTCQISGSCGTVTSGPISLTVYPLTKITNVSSDTEALFGSDITLNVTSEGHDLNYVWEKDGNDISNSNTSGLFLQNLNAGDIGIYRVTVTGTCGVQTSDSIYLYVKRSNYTADPQVFIWPSVTTTEFNVALNNDAFYNILIINTTGLKIREILNCRFQTTVNISTLAGGVYIIEVYNKNFRKSVKIIKV
jgi:hypothetical protein